MRNPFRSEAEAFRFVWLTIVYCALIVVASVINTWLGLAVFIVETAARAGGCSPAAARGAPMPQAPAPHPRGERRILVVANETVGGARAARGARAALEGVDEQVLVVVPGAELAAPALGLRRGRRACAAQERLEASLAAMRAAGIEARGEIGDGDPLQAIEDAHAHVRARRAGHLDAPGGPLELARARRRRRRARAVRAARSRTSSSTSATPASVAPATDARAGSSRGSSAAVGARASAAPSRRSAGRRRTSRRRRRRPRVLRP